MYKFPQINKEKTGKNIKYLCHKRGFNVSDLQQILLIGSNQAIYNWFNGKSMPSLDSLLALSMLLNVPINDILVAD